MVKQMGADIQEYYEPHQLYSRISQGLSDMGKDPDEITIDDLAAVDEFHIRGRESTDELLGLLNIIPGERILDVGCGLGGACRYIAFKYDVKVTGIDITPEYCRLARRLTEKSGLDGEVRFKQADALELPFDDEHFDSVLTLHTQMNVAEKERFYNEIFRVLKPDGQLAFYDIFADGKPVILPTPWADDQSLNHLISHKEVYQLLIETGFDIEHWQDDTAGGLQWFQRKIEKAKQEGLPPLGLHLLIGDNAAEKMKNVARNLDENKIKLIQATMKK